MEGPADTVEGAWVILPQISLRNLISCWEKVKTKTKQKHEMRVNKNVVAFQSTEQITYGFVFFFSVFK